jgi:DNA-binding transcriptional regulator GbsR (MarR family)
MCELKKLLVVAVSVGMLGTVTFAQEDPAKAGETAAVAAEGDAADAELENKLLKLTTLEQAFLKAVRTRNLLQRYIVQENDKLKEAEDEETKKELRKNIGAARKRLQTLAVAMDVIFGVGNRRQYEYDSVKSTVYLRVGTVEEAFARAVRTRELLRKYIAEQQAALEKEKDEAKKEETQKKIDTATRRYQTVAAALQLIYGVTPQRNYQYNPQNSTLYLRISESELEKLKAQLQKMQEEKDAAGEDDAGTEAPAEGAQE